MHIDLALKLSQRVKDFENGRITIGQIKPSELMAGRDAEHNLKFHARMLLPQVLEYMRAERDALVNPRRKRPSLGETQRLLDMLTDVSEI